MSGSTLSLHAKTHKLLLRSNLALPEISRRSGVGYFWLRKFKAGKMRNPGANTLQMLYEFLACRRLGL